MGASMCICREDAGACEGTFAAPGAGTVTFRRRPAAQAPRGGGGA